MATSTPDIEKMLVIFLNHAFDSAAANFKVRPAASDHWLQLDRAMKALQVWVQKSADEKTSYADGIASLPISRWADGLVTEFDALLASFEKPSTKTLRPR